MNGSTRNPIAGKFGDGLVGAVIVNQRLTCYRHDVTTIETNREEVIQHLLPAALRPQMTSRIRNIVLAGDLATVINDRQLRGTAADGSPVTMSATSADVMRRRADNTWGIVIDHPWALAG